MNAKAQTPATNAPTAKDESKNTASAGTAPIGKIKFVPLTEAEENEYENLKKDFDNLDDKGEARLSELKKKVKAADSAKVQFVSQLKTELTTAALAVKDLFTKEDVLKSFSITELFSQTEIDAVATKQASGKARKAQGEGASVDSTASKGEQWIKMPGTAPKYYKGQVYKKMSKKQKERKDFSTALGPSLPKNWLTNDTIEILMKEYATPEAKTLYEAKNEEFMTEMNDLVKAITTHKDYIAAKGTSGAGKQAA